MSVGKDFLSKSIKSTITKRIFARVGKTRGRHLNELGPDHIGKCKFFELPQSNEIGVTLEVENQQRLMEKRHFRIWVREVAEK